MNGQLPFTVFKVSKAGNGEHTITATHSLSVASIDPEQLMESLDSIVFQVGEQRPVLSRSAELSPDVEAVSVAGRDLLEQDRRHLPSDCLLPSALPHEDAT